MNRVYTNSDLDCHVFYITRSSSPKAWITYKAAPGNNSLAYAQSQATNSNNPLTNGNGILIDGRYNGHPHHIRIINNKVHDFGRAGIPII